MYCGSPKKKTIHFFALVRGDAPSDKMNFRWSCSRQCHAITLELAHVCSIPPVSRLMRDPHGLVFLASLVFLPSWGVVSNISAVFCLSIPGCCEGPVATRCRGELKRQGQHHRPHGGFHHGPQGCRQAPFEGMKAAMRRTLSGSRRHSMDDGRSPTWPCLL